jgi:hypothetical protein
MPPADTRFPHERLDAYAAARQVVAFVARHRTVDPAQAPAEQDATAYLPGPDDPARAVDPPAQAPAERDATAYLPGPDDPARARRLAWSELLRRVWREDVLCCAKCGAAMRLVAVVQEPAVCEKILRHLGLWQRGPPRQRRVVFAPPTLA